LLLNIIYAIGGWIPAIIGARLHDVVGRRKMLMGATAGMAVCLAIAAGTAANFVQSGSQQASVASITFIYIFGSVFALGFTSMQPIYPGEVLSNDMRAKGMGVFQLTSGCAGFVNTFAAPVALNKVRTTRVLVLSTQCDLLLTSEPDRLLVLRLLRVLGSFRIRFYLFLLC
jgi:MFS family permease